MTRYIFCILLALIYNVTCFAQSYGITFNSHEVVLERRTSLDLSPDDSLCFSKNFDLDFDISFVPNHETYFGYVLRIITHDNQNIDLIYNQPSSNFRIITGESFSGISFSIDSLKLFKEWNRFSLKFDLGTQTLNLFVNGKQVGNSKIPFAANCFKILWGANDFQKFKTRDMPPMQIRDIKIFEQSKLKYFWPLDEVEGNVCVDKTGGRSARATNPVWIKPKHQKWELAGTFTISGYANSAYNARQDKLYIAGSDSAVIYSLKNNPGGMEWSPTKHLNILPGNQAIYDTISQHLLDINIDAKKIVTQHVNAPHWDADFSYAPLTEFWHANKFISPLDSSLYIIGGYGQLRYKNEVLRYNLFTKKWDSLKTSGDYFPPRYLSASGIDPDGKYAYLIGGYGSQTGDQMLDPRNYYDLYRYDIKTLPLKNYIISHNQELISPLPTA